MSGKTLFARTMNFLPWTTFDRIVQRYAGNHHVRSLRCPNLLGGGCGPRRPPHKDPPDKLKDSHKMWGHVGIAQKKYRLESTR